MSIRRPARLVLAACLLATAGLQGCASNSDRTEAALSGPDVVSFKVEGMACPNCAKHIEHELAEVQGVRAAQVNFEAKTARVALDPNDPATMEELQAAVSKWKLEHFSAEEDADCLDPAKREAIKREGAAGAAKTAP